MIVLPNSEVKRAEAQADARSLSYEIMMENAGTALAGIIESQLDGGQALILCGRGRNAGDGFVAARVLALHGKNVVVARLYEDGYDSLTEKMLGMLPCDIRVLNIYENFAAYEQLAENSAVICDAIFGTGFRGELAGLCAQTVEVANASPAYKIAADVPSGLSDAGRLYFHADETVAMLCLKNIHALKPTSLCCGKITVADIGIEKKYISDLTGAYELITESDAANLLPLRPVNAHKGSFGHALVVAGSRRMPGAAAIAAVAALRSGAGLVTAAFPDAAYSAIAPQIPEALLMPLSCDEEGAFSVEAAKYIAGICGAYRAIAVGCGITVSKGTAALVSALIEGFRGTLIIDADGLNVLAKNMDVLKRKAGNVVLTPHPGEMSRLTGRSIADIESNRFEIAHEFAENYGVTLLLKGHNTIIVSPTGEIKLVTSGTNALSRGGAGDMLTGIIVSLVSYIDNVADAAALAAYLHGRAGALAGEESGGFSCAVGDIAGNYIGKAFGELVRLK